MTARFTASRINYLTQLLYQEKDPRFLPDKFLRDKLKKILYRLESDEPVYETVFAYDDFSTVWSKNWFTMANWAEINMPSFIEMSFEVDGYSPTKFAVYRFNDHGDSIEFRLRW